MCDLSVIILSYNTRQLTLACVESVLADAAAGELKHEVVVVDNGSSDDSANVLRNAQPTVKVIEMRENLGFSRGNNAGFTVAQGRHLLALNSDTLVQPGALRALVDFMDIHPDAGICGPMLLNEDGTLQPSGRPLPSVRSLFVDMTRLYRLQRKSVFVDAGRDYAQTQKVGEVSGAALLIRRSLYKQIGGFDEKIFAYYEDVDLCKRAHDAGCAVYYVPAAQITHLWGRSSKTVPELVYGVTQDSTRYYFRKHHGALAHAAVQAMLAGKEILLWAASTARRSTDAQLHRRMLIRALSPLP